MRELTDTEKRQLEQHSLWIESNHRKGERLDWSLADLNGVYLHGAALCCANLYGAQLSDADMHEARLRGANLYCANLCDALLYNADLREADMYRADLRGADLCGADLSGADLSGADLSGASPCGADLRLANLCGADLRGADMCGADLRGADLCGANLSKANGYIGFENVGSEGRTLHCTIHADGWHCYTGCFDEGNNTLSAFEAAVERNHAGDKYGVQYRAIITCLKALEPMYLADMKEQELNNA